MGNLSVLAALTGLAALAAPLPVWAQSAPAPQASVFDGDYLLVGAGAIYGPSYEGSDDQVLHAIPMVQGKLAGIEITPRQGGLAFDLVPDAGAARLGFSLGPLITYSRNRHSQIHDSVVAAAGKLDAAIDLGFNGGVTAYRLLNGYDSLTLSADVKWNVNGAYKGMVVSPGVSYFTPLSRAAIVTLGLSGRRVDDDYARYYYSVSPAQATASGLPRFDAKGGWSAVNLTALAGYDLGGNMLDGGPCLFVLGNYGRLLNHARANPYTAIRGERDQWSLGVGLGYTF